MKLTLGSDPEMHIFDNEKQKIVSSIPILKRDKHNPIQLAGGVKLYADNVLAEIAHPPVCSPDEGVSLFRTIFKSVREFLGSRYSLLAQAAHVYDKDELGLPTKDAAGEETNPAWATGCNPNNDAYIERQNPRVDFRDGLRTGSFHIHVGHDKLVTMQDKAEAAKLLDIYVGCPSVIFDRDPTASSRRRYYGRAGEFRDTPYGVEYRTLGNYPLRTPEMTKLVFDLVCHACTHIEAGTVKDVLSIKNIQQSAQLAINGGDASIAKKVIDRSHTPASLIMRINQAYEVPSFEKAWGL